MSKDEDIFSEDYGKGSKKPEPEDKIEHSEFTPPPPTEEKEEIEETPKDESGERRDEQTDKIVKDEIKIQSKKEHEKVNVSVGKAKVIGVAVIGIIIALVAVMATGIVQIPTNSSEPFDATRCQYGVKSGFMEQRCMTKAEFDSMNQVQEQQKTEEKSDEPFKEVSSTSDRVETQVSNAISGYFLVSSCCDWYGDFVDMNKVPKKIEKVGNTRVNFICYEDEHLNTSTYFGTFKNVLDPVLTVDVYINGKEVESKTTTSGSALILEGSCLGFKS